MGSCRASLKAAGGHLGLSSSSDFCCSTAGRIVLTGSGGARLGAGSGDGGGDGAVVATLTMVVKEGREECRKEG